MAMTMALPSDMKRTLRRSLSFLRHDRQRGQMLLLLSLVLFVTQSVVVGLIAAHGMEQTLVMQTGIKLNVLPTAASQDVQDFFAAAHSNAAVKTISLVTKEHAYEDAKRENPSLIAFIDQYKIQNPFRDTFIVTLTSAGASDAFRQFASQDRWTSVVDQSFLLNVAGADTQGQTTLNAVHSIQVALIVLLVVLVFLLIYVLRERMLAQLRAHGAGAFVQEILGAPKMVILLPLVFSLAMMLCMALALVTILILVLLLVAPMVLDAASSLGTFPAVFHWMMVAIFPWIVLLELCLMPAISYATALLGTSKVDRLS